MEQDKTKIEKIQEEEAAAEAKKNELPEELQKSNIGPELLKYKQQIAHIQDAIESVNLNSIYDPEEKIKAAGAMISAMQKLPALLDAYDDMLNKNKLKSEDIKGSWDLSPMESGSIDINNIDESLLDQM